MPKQFSTNGLGASVKRLHQLMDQRFNEVLRPHGLARSQWYALYHVANAGTLTQKQLQQLFQVESATMTELVDSLVRKGWLTREPNPQDRRVKQLRLTPAGEQLWDQLPDPILAVRKQMLAGIAAESERQVQQVLEHAIRNLEM